MRLRVHPEIWRKIRKTGTCDAMERYLNSHARSIYEHRAYERRDGRSTRKAIEAGDYRFMIQRTEVAGACWDYDLVDIQAIAQSRLRLTHQRSLTDRVVVRSPEDAEQGFWIEDKPEIPSEIGFVLHVSHYQNLAGYLKAPILLAKRRLGVGRTVQRVVCGNDALFLLTSDPNAKEASTVADEKAMDEALAEANAGCILSDPYELNRLRALVEKFGGIPQDGLNL